MDKSFDPEICRELAESCAYRFQKRREFKNDTLLHINNYFGQRSQEAQANHMITKFSGHPRIKWRIKKCKNRFAYVVFVLDEKFEILPQRLSSPSQQPKSRIAQSHIFEIDSTLFQSNEYVPDTIPVMLIFGGTSGDYDDYFAKIGFHTGRRWVSEVTINLRTQEKSIEIETSKIPETEISSEPTIRLKKPAERNGDSAVS